MVSKATVALAVGAAAVMSTVLYLVTRPQPVPPSPPSPLSCSPGTHEVVGPEPDGSYIVTAIAGVVNGGELSYDFKFYWSDGEVHDRGSLGTDTRTFVAGASLEIPTRYTVTSADGQTCGGTA